MAPAGARLRLRLVNLSRETMRVIGIEGARAQVVAIDGQPCDPFEPLRASVPITPGARFDILCDLQPPPTQARLVLRESERPVPLVRFAQQGAAAPPPRRYG